MGFRFRSAVYRRFRRETKRNDAFRNLSKKITNKKGINKNSNNHGCFTALISWTLLLPFLPLILLMSFVKVMFENLFKKTQPAINDDKQTNNKNITEKLLFVNPSNKTTDKFLDKFGIPEPTRSLLWITDEDVSKKRNPLEFTIEIRTSPKEPEQNKYNFYAEPSLIWTRVPIKPSNQRLKKTFYYPSYTKLSPEQRWEYLNWLKDITQKTNLSYVFLYYYGLERHLLFGNYDGAVEEIFRLIKYHNERSFPHYAVSAMIVASAHKKRLDIIERYPEILYELTNESLYLRMLSGVDLNSEDILNLFNQKKIDRNHYVIELAERYPELFKKELTKVFNDYVVSNGGLLNKLKGPQLERRDTISFANVSFSDEMRTFKTVEVLNNRELQVNIRKIISETYKRCKRLVNPRN